MKLLIVTQALDRNDPILGFFHRWVEEFAKHAEAVVVFALRVGSHDLPANVTVFPLRPEGKRGRIRTAFQLIWLSWTRRASYGSVFVHMNVEHVLAAGWIWRLMGKRVALWYTHGTVSLRLRLAIPFTDFVCTASDRSMRVATRKKRVMGHGMDLGALTPVPPPERGAFSLLTVGRISPVKRVDMLIDALALLSEQGVSATLRIAGNGEPAYVETLKALARNRGISERVKFLGSVKHADLPSLYRDTHLFLHASATGSLDKAALEPLACGVPVITANQELATSACPLVFGAEPSAPGFKEAMRDMISNRYWDDIRLREASRAWVERNHALVQLIPQLLATYED